MRKRTLAARLSTMAIAAAACLAPAVARAAPSGPDTLPLNVVAVEGNDAEDQAEALTKALRNAVREMHGWSLTGGDYSMEVLVLSMKCSDPPDAACQAKIADEIKVDRYIWGWIKKKGPNVAGELAFWVRGKGTTRIPIEYSANLTEPNDEALKKVAMDAVVQLTGGAPKGGVHVKAGNVGGQLFIDNNPVGALVGGEATMQIPSGLHTITVKAPGYDDAQTQISVKPNATTEATLTLIKATQKTGMSGRAIAGWSLLGGGIALAAGGGVVGGVQLATNSSANNGAYGKVRDATPSGQNPCDFAKTAQAKTAVGPSVAGQAVNQCSTNSLLSTLQIILYPAGAVVGGVGIYLLVTSPSRPAATEPQTGWTFQPDVGPMGGSLTATYRF
ncbi:MAG TPA: PEGA domain-containing protein [Minicystis sp.]|nr:PEGA domain-containing protein [Minicystis sp.]